MGNVHIGRIGDSVQQWAIYYVRHMYIHVHVWFTRAITTGHHSNNIRVNNIITTTTVWDANYNTGISSMLCHLLSVTFCLLCGPHPWNQDTSLIRLLSPKNVWTGEVAYFVFSYPTEMHTHVITFPWWWVSGLVLVSSWLVADTNNVIPQIIRHN